MPDGSWEWNYRVPTTVKSLQAGGYSLQLGPRAVTGECGAWGQTENLVLAIKKAYIS